MDFNKTVRKIKKTHPTEFVFLDLKVDLEPGPELYQGPCWVQGPYWDQEPVPFHDQVPFHGQGQIQGPLVLELILVQVLPKPQRRLGWEGEERPIQKQRRSQLLQRVGDPIPRYHWPQRCRPRHRLKLRKS